MDKEQRFEVAQSGKLVIDIPHTTSDRKKLIEQLFSRFGWQYQLVNEISQNHYFIKVVNENMGKQYEFHLYHGNVRKEDPNRNREEKKIQLGGTDPRETANTMSIILGFYVYDSDTINDCIIVAWPIEMDKNYPNNPSLRVNVKQDLLPAKNNGIYIDRTSGKRIVAFNPDFVYYYLENYKILHGEIKENKDESYLSPQWFAKTAMKFSSTDVEAEQLYKDFREKYGPEVLKSVSGLDLLHKIFINETRDKENLCYVLEFDKQYNQFGGIGGGTALKYGLYYSKEKESWLTGSSKSPKFLTVDEAITLGTKIRDEIIAGVEIIQSAGELSELKDYAELNAKLFQAMPSTINKQWVLKYFHMLFPQIFPPFYNYDWQNKVLKAIDAEPDENAFVRMGQIALFVRECGISTLAFSKVIHNLGSLDKEDEEAEEQGIQESYSFDSKINNGNNIVVYGTPGCGKSYYVQNILLKDFGINDDEDHRIRTTFYQDYTNTDFVGQIIPKIKQVGDVKEVTYEFNPGPFALALKMAVEHSDEPVALIIEELNRGNAPSIFGDIFQLLDRDENHKSQYKIVNVNLQDYLNNAFKGINLHFDYIMLPSNLYLVATMNTSDQNVFTLDTAFKRRWKFEKLQNVFKPDHKYADYYIPGMPTYTWKKLVTAINKYIVNRADELSSEDKQLGVYFIGEESLCKTEEEALDPVKKKEFAYKLLEYLWDDVAKFVRSDWFNPDIKTLDQLIEEYVKNGESVFINGIL